MEIPSLLGHTQELLNTILKSVKPADILIDSFFRSHRYLGSHDRRFIAETTYGTLRYLRKCKWMLNSILSKIDEPLFEKDKVLLLTIIYLFLQGNWHTLTPSTISKKLKNAPWEAKLPRFFDILSSLPPIQTDSFIEQMEIEHSFPHWLVMRLINQYGESETEKICSSLNVQAPLTIRVNTLRGSVEQCQSELRKQKVETIRTSLSPFALNISKRINVFSLPAFRNGWFEVQDEGSQLLPLITDPKPISKVLDVCAGAGGKTLEFSALMKNRGEIYATDINKIRLNELHKRAKRAGSQNIRVQKIRIIEDLQEQFNDFFDIVFVDAPCSGVGTIRRNPGMKWNITEQTICEVTEKQLSILHSCASLTKPGGRLFYATCTLLKEENETQIDKFLSEHSDYILVNSKGIIEKWNLEKVQVGSFIKLFPHIHGTDGFFCAVLERRPIH